MTGQFVFAPAAAMVLLGIAAWCGWRVFRPRPCVLDHAFVFFPVICLCLLALRWPHIKWPHEFNMDESQLLVEAARFIAHPIPWRDVDGTTSGPLNYMALSAPLLLGAPISWTTTRLALWAMQCLTLFFLYLGLRTFGSRAESRLVLLPTIFFYAFAVYTDFLHYSSETLPSLLLAIGLYLLCREWSAAKPSLPRIFAVGCLAGTIPFAKLQALPLAAFLVLVALGQAAFKHQKAGQLRAKWFQTFGTACLGALLIPGLIMGVVIANGAFNDFWKSYILASAAYAAQEPFQAKIGNVQFLLSYPMSDFKVYFATAMTALVLFMLIWRGRISRLGSQLFWPFVVIMADSALTLFCFFVAGKRFYHYTYLLVPPLGILFGVAFFGTKKLLASPGEKELIPSWGWKPVFLVGGVIVLSLQLSKVSLYLGNLHSYALSPVNSARSPVAEYAASASQPGDTLSVWGWTPSLYVETGLPPATRDTISHYIITQGPYQAYFRARYLNDFQRAPPAIFIDAIANGMFRWQWTLQDTHETFPELTRFINENYSLWLTIHLTNSAQIGSPIRLYPAEGPAGVAPFDPGGNHAASPADGSTPVNTLPIR